MNILSKVARKAMLQNKTRTIVTIIGIILSAAMFTAVTTMVFSMRDFLIRGEVYDYGDYFIQFDYVSDDAVEELRQNEAITQLADYQALGFLKTQADSNGPMSTFLLAAGDEAFFDTMPAHLTEGRLPQNSSEIALPERILDILAYYGMGTEIGDTITMELITDYDGYSSMVEPEAVDRPFTKTYTIVGYIKAHIYRDYDLGLYSMLTYADGQQGEALWHRAFVKCAPGAALELYKLDYGCEKNLNTTLLGYYGVTQFDNYNQVIIALAAVLCAIIMVGSVSLIYNAFSISVSERTKQFGLLASVGATKKQIRGAVFYEALTVSGIGIPLGLVSGYAGIAVTLNLLSSRIDTMFSQGDGTIHLRAMLLPEALLSAAAVALVTVLISAAIPARRAAKISPVESIRQAKDYAVPRKNIKVGKLTYQLFGLPGVLGKKYYKVSRKKYRSTVVSLTISFVLFISAACFSQSLRAAVENTVDAENYDMYCWHDRTVLEALREQDFVTDSVFIANDSFVAFIPDSQHSEEFLDCWDDLNNYYTSTNKNVADIRIYYLEDAVLEAFLKEQGIDPAPYFDPEDPMALVCAKEITTYAVQDDSGDWVRYTYAYQPFAEDTQRLRLFQYGIPDALQPQQEGEGAAIVEYGTTEDGELLMTITSMVMQEGLAGPGEETDIYLVRLEEGGPGRTNAAYYAYDPATGTAAAEAAAQNVFADLPQFRLGEATDKLPFGVQSNARDSIYETSLILPLSAAPENIRQEPDLCINVSDYTAAVAYLDQNFEGKPYYDLRAGEESNRTLLLMINVFSWGFIVLISLISIANVFNTISTNVALRKRDFGMLRSTGFREKDLMRMMRFECLTYGSKALLWGVPISLVVSYGIFLIDQQSFSAEFTPPWAALAVAAVCVFAVVFSTMFYAVSKLRKDNPIDAIRMETT